MIDFSEDNITDIALERLEDADGERFTEIMTGVIRHLHNFVRDVELTQREWEIAIDFLTRTGQKCDHQRQEFILLSDTLGASMLVDAISNRKSEKATESSVLGPFYRDNARMFEMGDDISGPTKGVPTLVRGKVVSATGDPIPNAILDIWQASPDGLYEEQDPDQPEMNLRGRFRTGPDGSYHFRTIQTAGYPIPIDGPVGEMLKQMGRHNMRPGHIHFIVSADGYETVKTELYSRGDKYLETDTVFGVKESLVIDYTPLAIPSEHGFPDGSLEVNYDFGLDRAA
jgi:hydroxyquinol 1,2-dioxygenase